MRYVQCKGPQEGAHGAPFVDLRVAAWGLPGQQPDSLEACGAEQLLQIFGRCTAFAGLACVLEDGLEVPGCGPEVVCWHACFRTWPPEDTAACWAAMQVGQHPTGDCGRVCHRAAGERYSEWYEYDLSGKGYEELWRRLPPAPAAAGLDGSAAFARCTAGAAGPFEMLVLQEGCFGYFRDSRPPGLSAELRELSRNGLGLDAVLMDPTRSIEWRRAAVDCECSVGTCDGWRIEQSILPWRVGAQLRLVLPEGLTCLETGAYMSPALRSAIGRAGVPLPSAPATPAPDFFEVVD